MREAGSQRLQECAIVSGDGHTWYLINVSPDIRTQILRTPELTPGPGRRDTPLRGVILTDAELDHTAGLLSLREAASLDVYATETVLSATRSIAQIVSAYGDGWRWHTLRQGEPMALEGGLEATPFPLGPKRPRYAANCDGEDWVSGLRLRAERTIVYAPCFPQWPQALDEALQDADIAIIDGTFHTADEMPQVRGHLPIVESLPQLARHPLVTFRYTHINNTNPLLADPKDVPLASEMELL